MSEHQAVLIIDMLGRLLHVLSNIEDRLARR